MRSRHVADVMHSRLADVEWCICHGQRHLDQGTVILRLWEEAMQGLTREEDRQASFVIRYS